MDTALSSPMDIVEPGEETLVSGNIYAVKERSVVVLISKWFPINEFPIRSEFNE
ncbi:hypothetical protein [Nostoc sp. 'Peltigera membranacea cyanobiont' 232]|uniref:hypothetical protein n=1 Tax=Nostoc sp. 'Peltigera membranacea cyanobiont' 232 TaxID=2014531 RepID=UPI001672876F|nr:hypothetical protein [Nostoc sp. 'Peltigera membranacea cyanobiont' 232]